MATQEVAIKQTVNITLKSDAEVLEEVVVTGYGVQRKASFTGAAAIIGEDVIAKKSDANFVKALEGAVPGVQMSNSTSMPGVWSEIYVRGRGSLNSGTQPLYVIDGVPVVSGDVAISAVTDDSKSFNIMSSINPSDIENITVLKDAAAASLYGSRAANGVILITTKKGKAGKTRINFKANWGFSDWAMKNRENVNGTQRRELTYEGAYNEAILYGIPDAEGNYTPATEEQAKAYAQAAADTYAPDYNEDWESALFRKHGSSQNYEFSAQGGDDRNSFFASLAYKKDQGKANNSKMDGFIGRIMQLTVRQIINGKWEQIFHCQNKNPLLLVKEQLLPILFSCLTM